MNAIKNYESVLINTADECISSTRAYIIDSSYLDFQVSKATLDKLIEWVISNPNRYLIADAEQLGVFTEKAEQKLLEKFDLIIFTNGPIATLSGFIQYFNPQLITLSGDSNIKEIIITLKKGESTEENITDLEIVNTVIDIADTLDLGDKDYEYFSKEFTIQKEKYNRYTSRIDQLKEDSTLAVLLGELGVCNSTGIGSRFSLISSYDIAPFTHSEICIYNKDLALLNFNVNTGEYALVSMSQMNIFNSPFEYLSGFVNIPGPDYTFKCMSGTLLVYESENNYQVICLDTKDIFYYKKQEGETNYYVKLDQWTVSGSRIEFLSDEDLESQLYLYTGESFKKNQYRFNKVKGGWFYIESLVGNREHYLISPHGVLILDHQLEIENLIPYSENLFLYKAGKSLMLIPIIYRFQKIFPRESDIIISRVSDIEPKVGRITALDLEEQIADSISHLESYKNLSAEERVLFDGLRKKPKRTRTMPQDIILGFRGIIGYTEEPNTRLYIL